MKSWKGSSPTTQHLESLRESDGKPVLDLRLALRENEIVVERYEKYQYEFPTNSPSPTQAGPSAFVPSHDRNKEAGPSSSRQKLSPQRSDPFLSNSARGDIQSQESGMQSQAGEGAGSQESKSSGETIMQESSRRKADRKGKRKEIGALTFVHETPSSIALQGSTDVQGDVRRDQRTETINSGSCCRPIDLKLTRCLANSSSAQITGAINGKPVLHIGRSRRVLRHIRTIKVCCQFLNLFHSTSLIARSCHNQV